MNNLARRRINQPFFQSKEANLTPPFFQRGIEGVFVQKNPHHRLMYRATQTILQPNPFGNVHATRFEAASSLAIMSQESLSQNQDAKREKGVTPASSPTQTRMAKLQELT
ncbi:MAG: hypothetical protein RQ715_11045 [Methylococcales bacterium]|nr:hypothetical protein [Methylococcales bacterium]